MADPHFMLDLNRGPETASAYSSTESVRYFEGRKNEFDTSVYPYTSMKVTQEGFSIDIREGRWDRP